MFVALIGEKHGNTGKFGKCIDKSDRKCFNKKRSLCKMLHGNIWNVSECAFTYKKSLLSTGFVL